MWRKRHAGKGTTKTWLASSVAGCGAPKILTAFRYDSESVPHNAKVGRLGEKSVVHE